MSLIEGLKWMMQIPEAATFTPAELKTYKDLTRKSSSNTPKLPGYNVGTHDCSGLVPGGFIVWLVWEIVLGLRLGDSDCTGAFWALERHEKDQVRAVFTKDLL